MSKRCLNQFCSLFSLYHGDCALALSLTFCFGIVMNARELGRLVHYLASPVTILLDQNQEFNGTERLTETLTALELYHCFVHSFSRGFLHLILCRLISRIKSWSHARTIAICDCCCPCMINHTLFPHTPWQPFLCSPAL